MKKTPWFPGSVKPVREGWYECDYSGIGKGLMRYFKEGKWWGDSSYLVCLFGTARKDRWRGLTEQAK